MVTIAPRYFLPFLLLWLLKFKTLEAALSLYKFDFWCATAPNNTMLKDPNSCNKYITCVDQKPIEGKCEKNLFFDLNTQSCVEASKTKCLSSDPCAATPGVNGFVADPYTCNGYYYCINDQGTRGICPLNMNFNPDTKTCISNLTCDKKSQKKPNDYCNIVPEGVFMKIPNSCTDYKVCWHGELIIGSCPHPYYFNDLTGACDYPENVQCDPKPEEPEIVFCTGNGVFVSDFSSCDGYYYCTDGFPGYEHGKCPMGTFFDPANGGACIARTDSTCALNRCANMGYGKIEFANINDDGCTGFYICQDGEVIGDSECPSGYYFDEVQQRCTTEEVSYPVCASAEPDSEGEVVVVTFTTPTTDKSTAIFTVYP